MRRLAIHEMGKYDTYLKLQGSFEEIFQLKLFKKEAGKSLLFLFSVVIPWVLPECIPMVLALLARAQQASSKTDFVKGDSLAEARLVMSEKFLLRDSRTCNIFYLICDSICLSEA